MKSQEIEILEFYAIALWEFIIVFLVTMVLVYEISEKFIANITRHPKLIVFLMILVVLFFRFFHKKRSKKMNIQKIKDNIRVTIGNNTIVSKPYNISIRPFIHKKLNSHIIRINNSIYLISLQPSIDIKYKKEMKEDINKYKTNINRLKTNMNLENKYKLLDYIPITLNISFYLLMIVAILSSAFLIIAITTNNTQWFNYFKN